MFVCHLSVPLAKVVSLPLLINCTLVSWTIAHFEQYIIQANELPKNFCYAAAAANVCKVICSRTRFQPFYRRFVFFYCSRHNININPGWDIGRARYRVVGFFLFIAFKRLIAAVSDFIWRLKAILYRHSMNQHRRFYSKMHTYSSRYVHSVLFSICCFFSRFTMRRCSWLLPSQLLLLSDLIYASDRVTYSNE